MYCISAERKKEKKEERKDELDVPSYFHLSFFIFHPFPYPMSHLIYLGIYREILFIYGIRSSIYRTESEPGLKTRLTIPFSFFPFYFTPHLFSFSFGVHFSFPFDI